MFPTLFELSLGDRTFAIDSHGLLVMLGAVAGLLLTMHLAKRAGLPIAPLRELVLEVMLLGAVGARAFFVAFHASSFWAPCQTALGSNDLSSCMRPLWRWEDGFSFPGGLLTALVWLAVRAPTYAASLNLVAEPDEPAALSLADLMAPGLALAQAFAKIGCFLAGCCFGVPTNGRLGVEFPDDSVAYQRLLEAGWVTADADRTPALVPVQLYEAAANAILCIVLLWLWRRYRERAGVVLTAYFVAQVFLRLAFVGLHLGAR
jgi:phosphatidylglycerol:prolipoprotein diacylglycerol transferase